MNVAVLQSNYLPWKGYFDIIHGVDMFVFYDDVQFTKNDWRNRNLIKAQTGPSWLSVPVGQSIDRLISDVTMQDAHWQEKHWKTLIQVYRKAPYFTLFQPFFEDFYRDRIWKNLSEMNQYLITEISGQFLGVKTAFANSSEYGVSGEKFQRLLSLLQKVRATEYTSGPAARSYLDEDTLMSHGINLHYVDYNGYPEYPQHYPPFTHNVSIVDLLFHTGTDAPYYIWGWRQDGGKNKRNSLI